jgi:hypothetical protein
MPNAIFPGSQSPAVTDFLRGVSQSSTFHNFTGIGHARNWAGKYFGRDTLTNGYSATATEGGRGNAAFVTVCKTKVFHNAQLAMYNANKKELKDLASKFGDSLKSEITDELSELQPSKNASSGNGPSHEEND